MIIGREREKSILADCFNSDKSEFVVLYGRRRVGKTYLIRELFEDKFTFYTTGILNGNRDAQLHAWNSSLSRYGNRNYTSVENWLDAFENLNLLIETSNAEKKVVFLDEVPWMATMHSDFLAGLDYFWNRWASSRRDVLLIICGSAASWICNNIIGNTAGLHNRLTRRILLEPFTLNECEQYFANRRLPMTRFQIAEAYMIFGGIPYYLSLMEPQFSLYQNTDIMYFKHNAPLHDEFEHLYSSLFKNSDTYVRVIESLAKKGVGLTRSDLVEDLKISDGGSLTRILKDLTTSGFIRVYKSYGQKKKDSLYQLVDFFSLFDVRFRKKREEFADDYWLRFSATAAHSIWRGYSYEKLCLLHLTQIRKKLGISGVLTSAFSWRGEFNGKKSQVDLVIDRGDNIVNLCEVKCASGLFTIDKQLYTALRDKRSAFANVTHTRKAVQTTMITTFGLERNNYGSEITSQVILDDLFE